MSNIDPFTGRPLPADAIQRILFVAQKLHVYQIPPLTSTKGFNAGPWTAPPHPTAKQIFTARIRVLETSSSEGIKVDILLEDPGTGELFAAAPYTTSNVVQAALDSSRFFTLRVADASGMKATLGIGFEERSDAIDFGIALGDERRVLGIEAQGQQGSNKPKGKGVDTAAAKQDFTLRDGESIHIEMGGKGHKFTASITKDQSSHDAEDAALFSIAPPPPGDAQAAIPAISPPSGTQGAATHAANKLNAEELGFDDGEFGEFQ